MSVYVTVLSPEQKKPKLPELLTANLTSMETHKKGSRISQPRSFFTGYITKASQKLTTQATPVGIYNRSVHTIQVARFPQYRGAGWGWAGAGGGAGEHPEDVPPPHRAQAGGEDPLPSSTTSLPSWLH